MDIVDWIFPKKCVGCRGEGEYICSECQKSLSKPEGMCPMCCRPSLGGWTHPRCRKPWGMERLIVGLPYKGLVQQCLKKVKYKSGWDMIRLLYGLCEWGELGEGVLVAVPMWREKERLRGYNQAELVAQCLARDLPGDSRKAEWIERVRETRPMYGLTRKARQKNIEGAFKINHKSQILQFSNTRVYLVDDVWTTGATMRECTKVLKNAGIREVWGVTLAR